MRRHTVVTCSKPPDSLGVSGSQSVPQSRCVNNFLTKMHKVICIILFYYYYTNIFRPDSRQSGVSGASSDLEGGVLGNLGGIPSDISWSRNSLQDELIQSVSPPCKVSVVLFFGLFFWRGI